MIFFIGKDHTKHSKTHAIETFSHHIYVSLCFVPTIGATHHRYSTIVPSGQCPCGLNKEFDAAA